MTDTTSSVARHQWLENARDFCVPLLADVGVTVPANVRITIGFPSTGGRGKTIGQCWDADAVTDGHGEIFVSPRLRDSVEIMGVLIHELIHAGVGVKAKHGPAFKKPALAVGLVGKMTATQVGEALREKFKSWVAGAGDYPAGAILIETRKKQPTRLLKAECETCGYVVRVTQKWCDDVGAPHCPDHGAMAVQGMSDFDPTDHDSRKPRLNDPEPEVDEPEVEPELPQSDDPLGLGAMFAQGEACGRLVADIASALNVGPNCCYHVRQSDPDHERFEVFALDCRAQAEARARQWSKTGKERMAVVHAMKQGVEVGKKLFTGGIVQPATGEYPLD